MSTSLTPDPTIQEQEQGQGQQEQQEQQQADAQQTRHPNEKERQLLDKLSNDPLDILTSLELIQYYESTDASLDKIRGVFQTLHETFPLLSFLWTIQLKMELARDEFATVESFLSMCLSSSSNLTGSSPTELASAPNNDLSLWLTYLDYVRRKNNIITGGQEARSIVIKAFELVLEKCANWEPQSSQFWLDYLLFLENWKPFNKWEEQQKIDMLRKLYKRMLVVPFDQLEKMWNKYTQWEQDVNSLTARKFIAELSPNYMKARSVFQEWSNLTRNLKRITPISLHTVNKNNVPSSPSSSTSSFSTDIEQLDIWLKWIEWEKQNKLELSEELLMDRLNYVYKQAIQYLIFNPEIWYRYSMFLKDPIQREYILNLSLRANPTSATLTFKLSECFESNNQIDETKKCFEGCVDHLLKKTHQLVQSQESEQTINDSKRKLTFVYCIYMNTMKRLSGLSAARSVFSKCRKLKKNLTHDIYIENAYMEFQNQNDYKTPCKVLELGLKYFQNDGIYILKYLDFLILLNKDSQIKTLFEISIDKIEDLNQLKLIFKKILNYESKFGNLNNLYQLEKRFLEKFPNENLIDIFTDRYQIQNENLIKKLELRYLYDDTKNLKHYDTGNQTNRYKRKFDTYISDENNHKNNIQIEDGGGNGPQNKQMRLNSQLIPQEVVDLLSILPKRQYFKNVLLDSKN
ncbi:cleavage polyadenylation factor subunit RNA14 NDAI_0G04620 [Naumovozyma dairenensis CBS 421]|uniref:mRNA 3'-end-processing protein RNA14 n=1 Tax=Naumovozyma dairenensis (strain ATCC 10597 / BCRC 20456 / CBS 421 / NBRC 0211 / NRRL Y-12639) TaxID=1071378 RepID=J7RTA7_NAUDC|nr:hypothetical protein NDAI_0G04620 [Naumovozyma dairenensis CBS 421]CCK73447.1 hypothetical protein NDAI_0G04620 [Naumovozyma dairenensis CBS 421]